MDATEFFGLQPTPDPHRWVLPVVPGLATAGRFLFGGCALGAAIVAMEQATGRPLIWATGQYLSFAMVDDVMDIDVTIATSGHHTTQARVVGHVADREILTVNAALGSRPLEARGQFAVMPTVPSPDECVQRASRWDVRDTIMERMETRLAKGRQWEELDGNPSPDGNSALWIRTPDLEMSPAALAVLGDYVPFGIAQALGRWTRANSLDNTLRILNLTGPGSSDEPEVEVAEASQGAEVPQAKQERSDEPEAEVAEASQGWVLLDIRVHGVLDGFGHGLVHLWAQDGTLLATASQSAIVREVTEAGDLPIKRG